MRKGFKLEKIQFLPATAPNAKEPLICRACCAAGGICKPVPVTEEALTMLRSSKSHSSKTKRITRVILLSSFCLPPLQTLSDKLNIVEYFNLK